MTSDSAPTTALPLLQTLETPTRRPVAAQWPLVARFALLNIGLVLYGVSLASMIQAGVGLAPWDALHVGLSHVLPLTVGQASIGAGAVALATAYFWLRVPVGVGSALNMVLIGVYLDQFRRHIPTPPVLWGEWALFLGGVLGVGLATGTYIASGFGAGPRDSVVIGLHNKTGWPVRYLRSGIELTVLGLGWLLGAHIGWGTLVFAITIGPAMSVGMGLWGLKR